MTEKFNSNSEKGGMCRKERRKWKKVNWSRQGGMEIDSVSETESN